MGDVVVFHHVQVQLPKTGRKMFDLPLLVVYRDYKGIIR